MKKRIIVILSIALMFLNITACEHVKMKMPRVSNTTTYVNNGPDNQLIDKSHDDDSVDIDTNTASRNHLSRDEGFVKSKYKHFGIIISGPSGVGKTTIINALKQKHLNDIDVSISATTRLVVKGFRFLSTHSTDA